MVTIVHAIAHRKPFVTITPLARVAQIVNALALNDETVRREGAQSHSLIAPSILTVLDRLAKRRNNE